VTERAASGPVSTARRGIALPVALTGWRRLAFAAALIALVASLTPPLETGSSRYLLLQALQFCLLAIVVPCLTAVTAPWRFLGLGAVLERLQARRACHGRLRYAVAVVLPALLVEVAWRSSALADQLARHRWFVAVEAVTLLPAGLVVLSEIVPSPPLAPRLPAHLRMFVTAVSMWTIWIVAYLTGFASSGAYRVFAAVPHRAISVAADDQLASGLLWAIATIAFMPIAFWNLMVWLRKAD
jgi:cytochrome c oxidase assembly factor CtaG